MDLYRGDVILTSLVPNLAIRVLYRACIRWPHERTYFG